MTRHRIALVSSLAVLALGVLAVLVPVASGSSAAETRTAATTISVKAKDFKFVLSTKVLTKPGAVTFAVKNVGKTMHDFKINGKKTPLLKPGKSTKLLVVFKKKGKYPYLCTVPGHAALGMKGVFTVK